MFNSIIKLLLLAFVEIISIFLPDNSDTKENNNNDNSLNSTKLLTGDEVFSTDPKYMTNLSSAFWHDED